MKMARTVLFFAVMWITIVAATPIAVVALLLRLAGLERFARKPVQVFGRFWALLLTAIMGARLVVSGRENVPASGGVCFVGNHQGDLDTLIAMALIDRPFGFTAKKEAMFLPFIGLWVAVLGGVFIDRKSARKALAAIERGAARLRAGGAMIIFPEGTRSRGPAMREFRPGAFKLATMAEADIVPVTIDGAYKVWEEEMRIRPATVRVTFHPPVRTAGLSAEERRALSERVRGIIASGLAI